MASDYDGRRAEAGRPPGVVAGFPANGNVYTTTRLNIRLGTPSTRVPIFQTVAAGTRLAYDKIVPNGESVHGNPVWLGDPNGNYFWSGAVQLV